MEDVGLGDRWIFRAPATHTCFGATDFAGLTRLYAETELALNLCGAQEVRPEHAAIRCRVYLQT
ncbi:hypothetical protein WFJ45_24325, partial [Salmonella enterica subsp. enterica serovar Minnesota]|uniref:hypothetical protein n=1 Tax=Salmonella enterica TaxID=28901 RepID=UPI003D272B5F